jgi:serine/threonine-protein phosphatase 2A regulatory subunit A
VLYAIAEELGKVWPLFNDKNALIPILEYLSAVDETVVRDKSTQSIIEICSTMQEGEIQSIVAPSVLKLAQADWFTGKVSSCSLILTLYSRSGPFKEKMRKY